MNIVEAEKIANELMAVHDLRGWTFGFDQARRRFGACHWNTRKITLSRSLVELNDEEIVRNTILHEIAHALAGRANGHSIVWKQIARSIGCDGVRLYNSKEVSTPKKSFKGTCPTESCGRVIYRYRRMKMACGQCCKNLNSGTYSPRYAFTWERT